MTKRYSCDGGSIMIGNRDSRVCFPNGFGDGDFNVSINESCIGWRWVGTAEGDCFHVYSYDCLHGDELDNKENILYTLSGRYGVFCNLGDIVLEKWSD